MKTVLLILLGVIVLSAAALFIRNRVAATDPAKWHVDVTLPEAGPGVWPMENGHRLAVEVPMTPEAALLALTAAIEADDPSRIIAGMASEGKITVESRTAFWAFRDYATIDALPAGDGALVRVYARQELGKKDLGVNRARVEGWFRAAGFPLP